MSCAFCDVIDCHDGAVKRGYCSKHYQRKWKFGTTDLPERFTAPGGICVNDGCGKPVRSKRSSYCEMHYARQRNGYKRGSEPQPTECKCCGIGLQQKAGTTIYFCSERCSWKYNRNQPAKFPCVVCGVEYERVTSSKCCSDECRKKFDKSRRPGLRGYHHKRRADRYGVKYEKFTAESIFERDGWICQICKEPVDRDAPPYSPLSVVLDHIVSMAIGGDHVPSNTQCAHHKCNDLKGHGETKIVAKVKRIKKRRAGLKKPGKKIASRPFQSRRK